VDVTANDKIILHNFHASMLDKQKNGKQMKTQHNKRLHPNDMFIQMISEIKIHESSPEMNGKTAEITANLFITKAHNTAQLKR